MYKLLNFYNKCQIYHDTVIVNRKEAPDRITLSGRLAKEIQKKILKHRDYFDSFDKIIVYYDFGQSELGSILNAVLSLLFNDVEFRKAEPQKYKLLQVADFVCTMELLKIKRNENRLSKSESQFFYKPQELKKTLVQEFIEVVNKDKSRKIPVIKFIRSGFLYSIAEKFKSKKNFKI